MAWRKHGGEYGDGQTTNEGGVPAAGHAAGPRSQLLRRGDAAAATSQRANISHVASSAIRADDVGGDVIGGGGGSGGKAPGAPGSRATRLSQTRVVL